MRILSPSLMNRGTRISAPVSTLAGLRVLVAVLPLKPGSVSVISSSMKLGISTLELGGGVVAGFGHSAGDDVLGLGAHKGSALAGLDVLELDDLKDLAVLLKGDAVAELAC